MPTPLIRVTALLALLTPAIASAQSIANYNVNPLATVFASDSGAFGSRPSGAADGNYNPFYSGDGNFHHSGTSAGGVNLVPSPAGTWWYVDLGGNYDISSMSLFFRLGCCSTQNDGDWLELWSAVPTFSGAPSSLFSTAIAYAGNPTANYVFGTPITARYVSLFAGSTSSIGAIVVPELEVLGTASVATPEPATVGLVATGLVGILGVARRRKIPSR